MTKTKNYQNIFKEAVMFGRSSLTNAVVKYKELHQIHRIRNTGRNLKILP